MCDGGAAGKVDAVICVGCLIKGETMHFEYISGAVSDGIMQLGLKSGACGRRGSRAGVRELGLGASKEGGRAGRAARPAGKACKAVSPSHNR